MGRRQEFSVASPDKKSFLLRINPEVWAQIERLAAQELRSSNAQVEVLLREALARRGRELMSASQPDLRGDRSPARRTKPRD